MDGQEEKRRWKGPAKGVKAGKPGRSAGTHGDAATDFSIDDGARGIAPALGAGKRLKPSSRAWIERQLADPYVQKAQRDGYRSRAAYKFLEMDEEFRLITPETRLIDLGAAPGGWTQAAIRRGAREAAGVDLLPMIPIPGAALFLGDMLDPEIQAKLREALSGPPNLVVSDMAPNATGHARTDHLRIIALLEMAVEYATAELAPGGSFVGKVLQGGAEAGLLAALKRDFVAIRHFKPKASRSESAELYLVAQGFRGQR